MWFNTLSYQKMDNASRFLNCKFLQHEHHPALTASIGWRSLSEALLSPAYAGFRAYSTIKILMASVDIWLRPPLEA